VHRAISNLKGLDARRHRRVSDAHLPVYLDEFVFRHNRRGHTNCRLPDPSRARRDPSTRATYDEIIALRQVA
jgi:hypothetical protein